MFYSGGEMFESHSDECFTLKGSSGFKVTCLIHHIEGLKINTMKARVDVASSVPADLRTAVS